ADSEVVSADAIPAGVSVFAGVNVAAVTEFALMVLSYKLEEKSNILEYRQKLID
nr:hypothetical protein [Tanacetum cinerariifolium]